LKKLFSYFKADEVLSFKEDLDKAFSNFPINNYREVSPVNCILDPERLDSPFIDVDLREICEEAIQSAEVSPGRQHKCLHAFPRGKGGGKSRTVEEMKRWINLHHNDSSFALAITFNYRWTETVFRSRFKDESDCLFFNVILRMLSMFYGLSFDVVLPRLEIVLGSSLIPKSSVTYNFFLLATISHIMNKVNQVEMTLGRKNFILIIDETDKFIKKT
jgi:hypothetical protein